MQDLYHQLYLHARLDVSRNFVGLQAMTIDFSIVDANNVTVIPDTVVTLQELSNTVDSNCRCTMPTIPTQVAATYGQNYGAQCQAWDNAKCDELWGGSAAVRLDLVFFDLSPRQGGPKP